MRLFSYYVLHTFKNQLKKLFKTWVLIFVVACIVLGGLIGIILGTVLDDDESLPEDSTSQTEFVDETDDDYQFEFSSDSLDFEANDLIELIAGGIVFAVILLMAFGADKSGSSIFLPADVNLLFPSPMKPQSVLMFRLTTKLGISVLGSIYMLFQIPNLINAGLSIWSALAIVPAWCFTIVLATLIQMLIYTVSATHPAFKRFVRSGIYALLGLIVVGYLITLKQSGSGYFGSAVLFFNAKVSRWIPIWGWLKGFFLYAIEGNIAATMLSFGAILLSSALLIYLIWHIKADFYEDAMAKSEETAELLEAAKSEKSTGVVMKRKKDRSEKLRRDGLQHGNGANVFFFKTMYNRFRFAHMGFLTKTMEFYLVAAIGVGLITKSITTVAVVLAGLSFFRSLGNPLAQDTNTDYFLLIPESNWAKLFWSLIGGTANCFLDVLIPLLLGAIVAGSNPLTALLWLPLIISVDFYATNVGAFINLSVPVSAGKTLKQIVQVMFVYFGLLPDIIIMAIGLSLGFTGVAVIISSISNIGLGFLFFGLSPLFLGRR